MPFQPQIPVLYGFGMSIDTKFLPHHNPTQKAFGLLTQSNPQTCPLKKENTTDKYIRLQ